MTGRLYPIPSPSPPQWEKIPEDLQQTFIRLTKGRAPWPFYLWGAAGVGKTYAAFWLLNQVDRSAYLTVENLTGIIWQRDASLWRIIAQTPLAVIDEIGARGDHEYLAIKRAADLREEKPTIWISNLTPAELLAAFDDRIFSRLCCGTLLGVSGFDQRFLWRNF